MLAVKKETNKLKADPIDIFVGKKIRQRRTLLGISQEKLSNSLNITFQQVQKYESGANRVSSSRLYNISKILKVTISYFFEGLPETSGKKVSIVAEKNKPLDNQDVFTKKETIDLVKTYYIIKDEAVRKKVLEMVKSIANTHKLTQKDEE